MNMRKLLYVFALACTALACSKSELPAGGGYPADGVVRISPTVAVPLTRTEGSTAFNGFRLGLGLFYGYDDKYSKTALWKKGADGRWNSSPQLLWKNAEDEVLVYAYVPDDSSSGYNDGLIAPSGGIPSDQSAGLESADWLWYSEKIKPGEALGSDGKLKVEMNHALLKLTVNLSFGDEFGGTAPEIKEVWLNGTMKKVYVSYKYDSRGQLSIPTASQSLMDIKMHKVGDNCYEAIFYPSTGQKSGEKMLTVVLKDGRDYCLKLSEDLPFEKSSDGTTYLGGCAYSISAKVGKDKVQMGTIKVAPWNDKSVGDIFFTDAAEYSEWDGKEIATAYAWGTGTSDDPYQIATAAQLAFLAQECNKGVSYESTYFQLMSNIDLMGHEWTPIGVNGNCPFDGIFDGDGKTVLNLNVPKGQYAGLFGYCSPSADIKNLKIRNVSVASEVIGAGTDGGAGIVAGRCYGSISNCTVEGTVAGNCYVGGIVGCIFNSQISDCTAEVSCIAGSGSLSQCGGIAGYSYCTFISDCTVQGKVKGTWRVGGFVGDMAGGEITVTNGKPSFCYADVSLYEVYKPSGGTETYDIGGLVGKCSGLYPSTPVLITGVHVSGNVSLPSDLDIYGGVVNLGGYIGYVKNANIRGNFLGSIEAGTPANGTRNAGAFIGWLDTEVKAENCKYYSSKVGNLQVYGAKADDADVSGLKITTFD